MRSCQYLHLSAVFFDKNLVKYIFGIIEYSSFGILHLWIIILDLRMGVFSTIYISLNTKECLVTVVVAYIVEYQVTKYYSFQPQVEDSILIINQKNAPIIQANQRFEGL